MSANQARRRTDLSASLVVGNAKPKPDNKLPYQGQGALDKDSIRLIEIQPADDDDDPVECTLSEVAFGSRPQFEALSYMWGTELADEHVVLNGFAFEVKKNLSNALRFLRRQVASGTAGPRFWIDAICINQDDVAERNRQLQIMEQIYFRATTVVVWLGSDKYTDFQKELAAPEVTVSDGGEKKGENPAQDSLSGRVQQEMVRYLRTGPYWERLWILQEIGRANKLRVCFGTETSTWDNFIHLIAMHNSDGSTGPLRLDRVLRQERYSGSHTLKRLLEDHKDAKCLDPRDKVYGLIGLATDAAGFPMDYNKSLYDVWQDTMVYMNYWKLFTAESQILPVGALVKSLLMAEHGDPLSQILRKPEEPVDSTQPIDKPDERLIFHLEAVALGCIVAVGPRVSDIVAKPTLASKWRGTIQRYYSAKEMGSAHREHDTLLHVLLDSDESDVEKKCFNRPSSFVWEDRGHTAHHQYDIKSSQDYIKRVGVDTSSAASQFANTVQHNNDRLSSIQPRLYMAKEPYSLRSHSPPRRMGIASNLVQRSDLVCQIRWSRRALLVRVVDTTSYNAKLRSYGTALATEDVRCGLEPDHAQRWKSLEGHWMMRVQLDAQTIFMLLS